MRVHWYFGDTGVCIVDVIYVMVKFPYQSTIIKKDIDDGIAASIFMREFDA